MDRTFEIAGLELDRRQIDGDLQRPRPGCRLAARFPQDPFADLDDQPVLLGKRNELIRRHEAPRRVVPAQQGLEADHLAIHPRLRLEIDQELVLLQCLSQIVLQQPAIAQLPVHLGLEQADPPPALAFGTIECCIGVGEQRGGIHAVVRIKRDADAEADMGKIVVDLELLADRLDQALGERQNLLTPDVVGHQDHELVAADTSDEGAVGFRGKPVRRRPHQHVADGMAEYVVDLLEAVEIEAEHGKTGRRLLRPIQPLAERGVEGATVRQVGQHVMMREVTDAFLGVDALGDVLDHADQILRIAGIVGDQHLSRVDDPVVPLDADFEQMLLEEHRHPAGNDPAVLLVDHAGNICGEYLVGSPAQHLLALQAIIVLAGAVEQDVTGILRALREHGDRDVLDDGVQELTGPQQVFLDLVVSLRTCVDHPPALAITRLIRCADELAQLGEVDLSGRVGGATKLLGEQAMHTHAIAPRRMQASCPQISIRIPALSSVSQSKIAAHSVARELIEPSSPAHWLPRPEEASTPARYSPWNPGDK